MADINDITDLAEREHRAPQALPAIEPPNKWGWVKMPEKKVQPETQPATKGPFDFIRMPDTGPTKPAA